MVQPAPPRLASGGPLHAPLTLAIAHTWDGAPLPVAERAVVQLWSDETHVTLRTFAPFAGDPPPPGPPGPTDRLWEHEVVELFLAGPGDAYLEVELGPWGHHLVLDLVGVRCPVRAGLPMDTTAHRGGAWWAGEARLRRAWLPAGPLRANAYRISGSPRRYHAHAPVPGAAPDFHRPDRFVPVALGPPPSPHAAVTAAGAALGLPPCREPTDTSLEAWSDALVAAQSAKPDA